MAEFSEAPIGPPKQERTTIRQQLKNLGGRIMQIVKRPEKRNYQLQEQAFAPAGLAEKEKQTNPERARRISEEGCAVRAIMSAAAFATGEKNISATREEWDARFKQMDDYHNNPPKDYKSGLEKIELDLLDLYRKIYPHGTTPLGKALKQVEVTRHKEFEDEIKTRIHSGEQVLINEIDRPHIFHAGLDKKGHIISLSDEKIGKRKYQRVNLSRNMHTIFSVTPKNISPSNVKREELALAA